MALVWLADGWLGGSSGSEISLYKIIPVLAHNFRISVFTRNTVPNFQVGSRVVFPVADQVLGNQEPGESKSWCKLLVGRPHSVLVLECVESRT